MKKQLLITSFMAAPLLLLGQSGGLDPTDILKPLADQWTSYSGDMSGKRYSALKQVNVNTVKNLSLRWVNTNITTGCGPRGTGPASAAAVDTMVFDMRDVSSPHSYSIAWRPSSARPSVI